MMCFEDHTPETAMCHTHSIVETNPHYSTLQVSQLKHTTDLRPLICLEWLTSDDAYKVARLFHPHRSFLESTSPRITKMFFPPDAVIEKRLVFAVDCVRPTKTP